MYLAKLAIDRVHWQVFVMNSHVP